MKIGKDDFRNEPFKFFCHPIGQDREGGKTLVFTRSTTGLEKEWAGYCTNFEKKLTSTGPGSPPDTGRFSVITKVCARRHIPISAKETIGGTTAFKATQSLLGEQLLFCCFDIDCIRHHGIVCWAAPLYCTKYARLQ